MRIGIFSFRAFDRRVSCLAAPISSGVRQGGRICPPSGARSAEYPSGARVNTRNGGGLKIGMKIGLDRLDGVILRPPLRVLTLAGRGGGGGVILRPPPLRVLTLAGRGGGLMQPPAVFSNIFLIHHSVQTGRGADNAQSISAPRRSEATKFGW